MSGGQLSATRTVFTENLAYYGGAIRFSSGGSLTLTDSEFSDNYAYYGGAVYADYTTDITDSGSQWVGNEAYYDGAAIYAYSEYMMSFEGSSFIENTARYGSGGAVYGYYGNADYTDVTFEDNYAYYYGGAVYAYYTYGDTTFTNTTFTDNTARSYGGAIDSYAYNNLTVRDSTFTHNESETGYGGAIYNYYSNATVQNSEFTANRALESMGGAIYSYHYYNKAPDLVIEDSRFTSNESGYHGGAIATLYNRIMILRSTFHVNDTDSAGMGGALFLQDVQAGTIKQCSFTGNNAGYGGAVYSEASYSNPEHWLNNTFVENTANIGGAVVWSNSSVSVATNNTFVGNSSVAEGGNIVLVNSSLTFTNNAVTHSTAGAAVQIYDEESIKGSRFSHNAWYEISDGIGGGKADEALLTTDALTDAAPGYTAYSPDGDADNDGFVLLRDSALIDAGDPTILDPDGSPSDIGAWGGSELEVIDTDGDGFDNWIDCDDGNPDTHPTATDTFYDGINSDCLSGSDFDADGDGEDSDAYGGIDCDDTDAAVQTDCGGDTITDTGEVDEDPVEETPGNNAGTDKEGGSCSHVSGGASIVWMAAILGLMMRRRREQCCGVIVRFS